MAKIYLNLEYDESQNVENQKGKYMFDAEDGSAPIETVVWYEKSKANDKHPEGKPWIKLPKDNVTNRQYFSEDLFIATAVNGEVTVEVKNTPPRVLGTTGVKQEIIKYLDEADAKEYETLVNNAVDAYKEAKANSKKKKIEDMSVEELQEYIECLKSGKSYSVSTAPKSFIDMFTEDEYNRYNELLAKAQENKANRPKVKRGPLSDEEKAVRKAKRIAKETSKAEALLAALLADRDMIDFEEDDEISDDDLGDEE